MSESVAWVPYWTAFLEHPDSELDPNWMVEVQADGSWAIFDWLVDEMAAGKAESIAAAKTEALGAFAAFVSWHEAATFTGPHLGVHMRLHIATGHGYQWQVSLLAEDGKTTGRYQTGRADTLQQAKADCESAAPAVVAGP